MGLHSTHQRSNWLILAFKFLKIVQSFIFNKYWLLPSFNIFLMKPTAFLQLLEYSWYSMFLILSHVPDSKLPTLLYFPSSALIALFSHHSVHSSIHPLTHPPVYPWGHGMHQNQSWAKKMYKDKALSSTFLPLSSLRTTDNKPKFILWCEKGMIVAV